MVSFLLTSLNEWCCLDVVCVCRCACKHACVDACPCVWVREFLCVGASDLLWQELLSAFAVKCNCSCRCCIVRLCVLFSWSSPTWTGSTTSWLGTRPFSRWTLCWQLQTSCCTLRPTRCTNSPCSVCVMPLTGRLMGPALLLQRPHPCRSGTCTLWTTVQPH